MLSDHLALDMKARATTKLLLGLFEDKGFIDSVSLGYQQICNDALARFGVRPRSLQETDRKRLTFGIACFSAFLTMGQEAPNLVVRGRPVWGDPPDDSAIRYFNTKLLECFDSEFQIRGIGDIREIVATSVATPIVFGSGEPLNFANRLGAYVRSGSSRKAFEYFAQQFALALDPHNYAALKMYGMQLTGGIVDLTRETLLSVFDSDLS